MGRMKDTLIGLEDQARDALAHYLAIAHEFFGYDHAPALTFDLKGRTAGQARRDGSLIRLNRCGLMDFPDHIIKQTVPHELAHCVAFWRYGSRIRPHGREWQHVMRVFGVPARTTHSLPLKSALRTYTYACACRDDIQLTSIRHNRIMRGASYTCRRCATKLAPVVLKRVE